MSSAHVFAHAPRDQLEPKSVTRYGHIQSISVFTILVDWTTAHKSSPNNSILYFFLHAVTNRVVVSMGLYSCLLFKTCRTYADLGLLVYLYIYNIYIIYTHTHTHTHTHINFFAVCLQVPTSLSYISQCKCMTS